MTLKDLRLSRGWTQDHLANVSGLSTRTIQRLENGSTAGAETLQALAAAFDTTVEDLLKPLQPSETDRVWIEHLRALKANIIAAAITLPALAVFSWVVTPGAGWVGFVVAGWGLAIALHAALVYFVYRPSEH